MLQRLGHVRMAAVGIRGVTESQPVVVTVQEQLGEALNAKRGLVRMMAAAHRSRSHRQAACLDARAPQRNAVRSAEFSGERRHRQPSVPKCLGMEPRSTRRASCSMQEFAPLHGTSLLARTPRLLFTLPWTR